MQAFKFLQLAVETEDNLGRKRIEIFTITKREVLDKLIEVIAPYAFYTPIKIIRCVLKNVDEGGNIVDATELYNEREKGE